MAKIKTLIVALALAFSPALAGSALAHGALAKSDPKNPWKWVPTKKHLLTTHRHYHEEWVCDRDETTGIMTLHYHYTMNADSERGKMSDVDHGLLAVYVSTAPRRPIKLTYFFDPKHPKTKNCEKDDFSGDY